MKIAIYQIVPEQDTNRVIFRNMEFVSEKNGGHIPAEIYECVYSGIVNANTLEEVLDSMVYLADAIAAVAAD